MLDWFTLALGLGSSVLGVHRLLAAGDKHAPEFVSVKGPLARLGDRTLRRAVAVVASVVGGLVGAALPYVPAVIGFGVGVGVTPFGMTWALRRWSHRRFGVRDPVVDQLQTALDGVAARRAELVTERRMALQSLAKVELIVAATAPDGATDAIRARALADIDTLTEAVAELTTRLSQDRVEALLVAWRRKVAALVAPRSAQIDLLRQSADILLARAESGHYPAEIAVLARCTNWSELPGTSFDATLVGDGQGTRRWQAAIRTRIEDFRHELAVYSRGLQLDEASAALGGASGSMWRAADDELIHSLLDFESALRAARPSRIAPDASLHGTEADEQVGVSPTNAALALEALRARNRVVDDDPDSDRRVESRG